MKSLLPYLIEFFKNKSILSKEYFNNYIVGVSDQRPIIMIIYDDNIFSTNDNCQKIWTLNSQEVL